MIQASNQLSPKTKVVALIVLYNFYFGKISCSNVKFGALDGQSRLKVTQSRSTGTSLFVLSSPPAIDVCAAMRRTSAILGFRVDTFLSFPEPYPFHFVPFFLERAEHPSNPSCRSPCRCRFRPSIAAVPRFPMPQVAQPRPPPSSLHLVLG